MFVRQSPAQYSRIEQDAVKFASEICAEYWAVSSLTGEILDLNPLFCSEWLLAAARFYCVLLVEVWQILVFSFLTFSFLLRFCFILAFSYCVTDFRI